MSDLGMAVIQLAGLFNGLINVYIWVLIIAVLLSFVNPDPYNPVVQFLYRVTNPAYLYIRRYMKTDFNGLDLAPLVLIVGLQIITIIISLLFNSLARFV